MMIYRSFCFGLVERIFLLAILFSCWAGSCLIAQSAQLDFRHYTVDDGLPSSEVYTVFEDRKGFIWLGTDNGVARFDGYEFTVFDRDDGLEDVVVFIILEDASGRLWVSTYSGKIFYLKDGRFYPYAYNHLTTELKKKSPIVKLLDVTDAGDMIIFVQGRQIVKVTPAGDVVPLSEKLQTKDTIYIYQPERSGQDKNEGWPNTFYTDAYFLSATNTIEVQMIGADTSFSSTPLQFTYLKGKFAPWYAGVVQHFGRAELVVVTKEQLSITTLDGKNLYEYPMEYGRLINYVLPGKKSGKYWFFFNRGRGIVSYDFFRGGAPPYKTTLLKGHSVSSGLFDGKGGFWVTTLDDGLYYCPYPEQQLYLKDEANQGAKSISLALTGPASFYAGYDDGAIFRYERDEDEVWNVQLPRIAPNERVFDLFYDSAHARVYTSFFSFKHPPEKRTKLDRSDVDRQQYLTYSYGNYIHYTYFNHFPESFPNKLYASQGIVFSILSTDGNQVNLESEALGLKFNGGHVLGVDTEGRKLLGTLHGLYEITEDGRMIPNDLGVPELGDRVVFIKHVNANALLFGTRGNGLVYLSQDTSYLIRESDGLASDMVRDLHKDHRGNFWVSTLNGLSKVKFTADGMSYTMRTFRTENGLPTNEVAQTDTWGDEVWLATSAGITNFVEPPLDTVSPKPTLRQVWNNGIEWTAQSQLDLPAGNQDVRIRFGTINYFLGNRIIYRYRIISDAPWQYSKDRTANYPNLAAGNYQFAVQSRNHDGFWSDSTLLNIYIATAWYVTWWAFAAGSLALLGALISYFLLRERRRKREQKLLMQISQLEHATLHAQMNPHFVFNSLNSIQNFVLENDAVQASTYLSHFARIIRQTLHSSMEGNHTLREELDMLRSYLHLEKLRFKDDFNYELTVAPHLPLEDIRIPPLLIQPFVENAIIHGLKERRHGGLIKISFTGSTQRIHVQIEDNGNGFDPQIAFDNHSMGMDITRRRLNMMNHGLTDHSGMEIESLRDAGGAVCGTRITLNIHLDNLAASAAASTR